jgi:hypothetical protein
MLGLGRRSGIGNRIPPFRENFEGWVVGFYGEWSDTLAKIPEKLADAQVVSLRWQSKYGREPTIQQRAWLVSKARSDIAMMATKLNAQVIIKNLQNMHEKSLPVSDWHPRELLARTLVEY